MAARDISTYGGQLASPRFDAMREYMRSIGRNPPERLTADHFVRWLDLYLPPDVPRPTREALRDLASDCNQIAERPGGAGNPILEEQARRRMAVLDSAQRLRADVAYYLEMASSDPDSAVRVCIEVDRVLGEAGIVPAAQQSPPRMAKPGRPEAEWHPYGHWFAGRFMTEMKGAGYKDRLGKKDEESITTAIGAHVVNHLYEIDLKPAGFASGMKQRRRSKQDALTLEERFPQLGRIRNLDAP